ncbi:hypothetical protein ABZ192_36540 [Streptomyces sp. NPDC006235]|uniref:hypothetical protein n=1 Tax=Streptomyces sp. NPDC006235 TaxID=3156736 RepID=UPI0033A0CDD8
MGIGYRELSIGSGRVHGIVRGAGSGGALLPSAPGALLSCRSSLLPVPRRLPDADDARAVFGGAFLAAEKDEGAVRRWPPARQETRVDEPHARPHFSMADAMPYWQQVPWYRQFR